VVVLRDSITVDAQPHNVFQLFNEMETLYVSWHPDHVRFRWVSGRGVKEGNTFYFEEYIAGKLLRKTVVFTRVIPNRHIEFAPTFWLMRLFLPRMVFLIEPTDHGCRFTAEIHLRMGPLAQHLQRKELAAIREHMRVEGENIQRLIQMAKPT
jgi:hypothetical protein